MRPFLATLTLCVFVLSSVAQASQPVAFVRVNIVPLVGEDVLLNQTVTVVEGRIQAIGKDIAIPAGA